MRWLSSAAVIIVFALLPSAHGLLVQIAGDRGAYGLGTILMFGLIAVLPAVWPAHLPFTSKGGRRLVSFVPLVLGLSLLAWIAFGLLPPVFAGPLDPNRGDMLVIIEHAIVRFLDGGNPYDIHKVPWDAPLSYGPVLWVPFIIPHEFAIDPRILTLIAQLVLPASLCLASAVALRRNEALPAVALLAVGIAIGLSPDIQRFHAIGHTQIYWPLVLFFALTLSRGYYTTAALALGLMVAARTTFVSIVPIFFIYLAVNRLLTVRRTIVFGLAAALPFLPFLVVAPGKLSYAMFGVYMKLMKGFVWYSTTWVQHTYGVTGRLLEQGLERYVEPTQVVALLLTYICGWRSLRQGARPEPWMVLSLLVFSMTTLWPVLYLYFDVAVLAACALLAAVYPAASVAGDDRGVVRIAARIGAAAAVCLIVVLGAAAIRPGSSYTLDVGEQQTNGYTGGGFGRDEAVVDDGRRVVWIEGETARVRLPRAAWRGADIAIAIKPRTATGGNAQRVAAALNGHALGMTVLSDGWQEIRFASRSRDWYYGFNVLDLSFSYATPAPESGDRRALAAAVDWIAVR